MIQRIQTLYLLVASVLLACMLILPLSSLVEGTSVWNVFLISGQIPPAAPRGLMIALAAVYVLLAFADVLVIFMYKNRERQASWITGILLILVLSVILLLIFLYRLNSILPAALISYHAGLVFPLVSLVLLIMARKAIRKDQDIIDSLNRIR